MSVLVFFAVCVLSYRIQTCQAQCPTEDQVSDISIVWGYNGNVYGPDAGGTMILLRAANGGLVDLFNNANVNLVIKGLTDDYVCQEVTNLPDSLTTGNFMAFLTPAVPEAGKEYSIQVKCSATQTEFYMLNKNFTYKPNPSLSRQQDTKSIIQGGIKVKVRGENLSSVLFPVMLIYIDEGNGIINTRGCRKHDESCWCKQICVVKSDNEFECVTPILSPNVPTSLSLSGKYVAGASNCPNSTQSLKVPTSNLNNPEEVQIYLTYLLSMEVEYNDTGTTSRRKRQTIAVGVAPGRISADYFKLGFVLDGVHNGISEDTVDDLIPLGLYENPDLEEFGVKDYYAGFHKNEDTLKISGQYIKSAATKEDYTITIGGALCPILGDLFDNAIICEPPDKPDDPTDAKKDGGLQVIVHVGYFSHSAGYLKYKEWYESPVFIGIICGAVGLVLVVFGLIFLYRWCNVDWEERRYALVPDSVYSNLYDLDVMTKIGPELSQRITASGLLFPENTHFKIEKKVGKGNFGVVYSGFIADSKNSQYEEFVAIKTLRDYEAMNPDELQSFFKEALEMQKYHHENVIKIYGIAILRNHPHIVMPFMRKGDLKSYVSSEQNRFEVRDLMDFAHQIAKGMAHVASQRSVHRDLAARNCMVSDDEVIKISDFGLAREGSTYYKNKEKGGGLPIRWMAPESITRLKFTEKTDVWSYGVVLWELMSRGQHPYPGVRDYDMNNYLKRGQRLCQPDACPDDVYEIMKMCWNSDPARRPSFSQLATILERRLEGGTFSAENMDYPQVPHEYAEPYTAEAYQYLQPSDGSLYRDSVPTNMAPNPHPASTNQIHVIYKQSPYQYPTSANQLQNTPAVYNKAPYQYTTPAN